ncbi:MAG: hypothetical protein U0457_16470 [Candidatus Sericytochromatia bacterium]
MLVFLIFLLTSISTGLWSFYKLKIEVSFLEKILYGFTINLSALIQLIFVLSFFLGLNSWVNSLFIAFCIILLIYTSKNLFKIKDKIKEDLSNNLNLKKIPIILITIFWGIIFYFLFNNNAFISDKGSLDSSSSTDLPFHYALITSFAYTNNFPPETPIYIGKKLIYPFLSDFFSGYLVFNGLPILQSMQYPAIILCTILSLLIYLFTKEITNNEKLSKLAPFLLFLGGGFGFWKFFELDFPSKKYNFLETLKTSSNYYTDMFDSNFQFYNFIIAYLLPQRSFLFGFPLALIVIILFLKYLKLNPKNNEENKKLLILSGITCGIMPLFHLHAFMSTCIITGFWGLFYLFRPILINNNFSDFFEGQTEQLNLKTHKNKLKILTIFIYYFIPLFILAIPQILYTLDRVSSGESELFKIHLGWMAKDNNYFWFWIKNTGFMFPLIIDLFFRKNHTNLKILYLPFLFLFILGNTISLSPCWIGDNAKVILFWFIGSIPLVITSLNYILKSSKIIFFTIFISLILSSSLDISRNLLTKNNVFTVWDKDDIKIANKIKKRIEEKAVFITAPVHYSPIFLTGRKIVLGSPLHACTQALDPSREKFVKRFFESTDIKEANIILNYFGVNYILLGPPEMKLVKDITFFDKNFQLFIRTNKYKIYKTKVPVKN